MVPFHILGFIIEYIWDIVMSANSWIHVSRSKFIIEWFCHAPWIFSLKYGQEEKKKNLLQIPLSWETLFDGEVRAISTALSQLTCRSQSFVNTVILSDSKAAISAVVNYLVSPTNQDILQCGKIIRSLITSSKNVSLQRTPSHRGIAGNEMADLLAKKGTHILQISPSIISHTRAATNICFRVKEAFRTNLRASKYRVDETKRHYYADGRTASACCRDSPSHQSIAVIYSKIKSNTNSLKQLPYCYKCWKYWPPVLTHALHLFNTFMDTFCNSFWVMLRISCRIFEQGI